MAEGNFTIDVCTEGNHYLTENTHSSSGDISATTRRLEMHGTFFERAGSHLSKEVPCVSEGRVGAEISPVEVGAG